MQASNSPANMQQQFEHYGQSEKLHRLFFISIFLFLTIQDGCRNVNKQATQHTRGKA